MTTTGPHHGIGVSPMLDIGGELGAVVVYLDRVPPSGELHARSIAHTTRFHTGVHHITVADTDRVVAVFPQVAAGDYELLDEHARPTTPLTVTAGHVTEIDLRTKEMSP